MWGNKKPAEHVFAAFITDISSFNQFHIEEHWLELFDVANIVCKTVYFEKPGPINTNQTLKLAKERAEELGIQNIIVASTTGETGVKASEVFKGYNLVVVTHVTGFTKPNIQQFNPKNRSCKAECARFAIIYPWL